MVYIAGLFYPLSDNDSAHHANIGLRMLLTGDYVNMIDHRGDYIDKPHFLFWISALSFKIFGVSAFAFRLPSLLFTIAGTYSIFRLGKELYDHETGKLAALLAASTFCYILANGDVRMDAILTACVAFSLWQLTAFVNRKKLAALLLAGIGLALGFITKGHIGIAAPAIGILFYIIYKKEWRLFYDPRWLALVFVFLLLIAPVVYCYYLQFDQHPEKVSQGMKGVSGVKYILWSHSFERLAGHERFGTYAKDDYFYFFHTFLWTFAPWSIIMFIAFYYRLRYILTGKYELLTTGIFILLALFINFSFFKLPHYMPVLAPVASLMAAKFLFEKRRDPGWTRVIFVVQAIVCSLLLVLAAVVNAWAFPVSSVWIVAGTVLLLSVVFYYFLTPSLDRLSKSIAASVAAMVLLFFLLNTSFYPKLLSYQGGKSLADSSRNIVDDEKVFFSQYTFSSSYNFYARSLRRVYNDSILLSGERLWIIYDKSQEPRLDSLGVQRKILFRVPDFEISRMNPRFINPRTRKETLGTMVMAEVGNK